MAEQRFPSIEDMGDDAAPPPSTNGAPGPLDDTDDDFLARERAALGEDAAQFSQPGETTNTNSGSRNMASVEEDGGDDLLGGGGDMGGHVQQQQGGSGGGDEFMQFEDSFPNVETGNENVGPGGTVTGADNLPYRPSQQPSYGGYGYGQGGQDGGGGGGVEEYSESMRQWRERRDTSIADREKISTSKRDDTVKAARQNIDDFYENYSSKTEKGITKTRKEAEEFLANRENTTAGGTSWERIAKLVDLSGKGGKGGAGGSGKEKFREMLLDLRKDEKAPGAAGV